MKLPIKVVDSGPHGDDEKRMLIVIINGEQVAKLSHDQAAELACKLLTVTCRISNQA